jgi:XTP/dITP diphosphohydrolase
MIEKSQLQHLVEVMDRLRSSGGCPWDAEQTHESLLTYLIEESYEFIDADVFSPSPTRLPF